MDVIADLCKRSLENLDVGCDIYQVASVYSAYLSNKEWCGKVTVVKGGWKVDGQLVINLTVYKDKLTREDADKFASWVGLEAPKGAVLRYSITRSDYEGE